MSKDTAKKKSQLIDELDQLRRRLAALEARGGEGQQSQHALAASHHRLVAENVADVVWTVDMNLRPTYVSPSMTHLLGYSMEESMTMTTQDVFAPESADLAIKVFSEEMARAVADPHYSVRPQALELELIRKNGSRVPVEGKFSLIRDDDGHPSEILAVVRDISERKRAEGALRESEERYRDLLESANDLIQSVDSEGRYVYVNETWLRTLGYRRDEIAGLRLADVVAKEELDHCAELFRRVVNGEKVDSVETVFRAKDGRRILVEGSIAPRVKDGRFVSTIGVFRDITDRRKAEFALRESEAKYRFLVDNFKQPITVYDADGTVTLMNKHGAETLGLTVGEVVGKSLSDLFGDVGRVWVERGRRTIEAGIGGEFEDEALLPAGMRWYHSSIQPIKDSAGRAVAVQTIAYDITERKTAEQETLQRNRELTALNAIAQIAIGSLDLDRMLDEALDKMAEILRIRYAVVYLLDQSKESLNLVRRPGMTDDLVQAITPLKVGSGSPEHLTALDRTVFVESVLDSPEAKMWNASVTEQATKWGLGSAFAVPLQARGETMGVMCAYAQGTRVFTPVERQLIATIGHELSIAMQGARLTKAESRARELEQVDRLRKALLANVSHELRTPLTVIKGLSNSLLLPGVEWDEPTRIDFLQSIERESDTLTHIVENLEKMAQLQSGMLTMKKSPTS
ncbi:MAG: PAS domain S-box protein, partial [Chloroflexi bacterium]|nr:PAS domain S-box protein [Chloroflexota bacterium]